MTQIMKSALAFGVIVALGGIVLLARGQSTARPGEPTQARVWVENRTAAEAVPVVVDSLPSPITVHIASQGWEYRTVVLSNAANGSTLSGVGSEGWEAVGVLQSGQTGTTVLFKRPR